MPPSLDIWSRNKLYKIVCQSKILWRNKGLSDQWAVEPMGCRTNGLSDQWAVGLLGRNRCAQALRKIDYSKSVFIEFFKYS